MRMALLPLATAIALSGGVALAADKPVAIKPIEDKPLMLKSDARKSTDAAGASAAPAGDGVDFVALLAQIPTLTKDIFVAADTDGNGLLSDAEIEAARAQGLLPV